MTPNDTGGSADMTGAPAEPSLVERLREEAERLSGHSLDRGSVDAGIAANLADQAATQITALAEELDEALRYATSFLVSYVNEHCDPVEGWKPLPDLVGVLTQIDNATTVTREIKAALAASEALVARLREALEPFARMAKHMDSGALQYEDKEHCPIGNWGAIQYGDFRRVRTALRETGPASKESGA